MECHYSFNVLRGNQGMTDVDKARGSDWYIYSVIILGLRPANERRRYKVTPVLMDWAQT